MLILNNMKAVLEVCAHRSQSVLGAHVPVRTCL